jgi:hypothetical protein
LIKSNNENHKFLSFQKKKKIITNYYSIKKIFCFSFIFFLKQKKNIFIVRFIYTHVFCVAFHVVPVEQAQAFGVGVPQTIFPGQIQCPK